MKRRTIVISALAALSLASVLVLAVARERAGRAPEVSQRARSATPSASGTPPVLWRMPEFSFANQHGKPTAPADLRGRVWIANFIFTRCTTICPLITSKLVLLQRRLPNPDLRFVSFSVDPEHDTPEVLARYAGEWRPGESRWILLSTTPPALQALAAAMYVSVKPAENDILHSSLFFLVDARGGVRGIYESGKDDALDRLAKDVAALSGEATSRARDSAATGAELHAALGCATCHARADLAPPLTGLMGRRVELAGGAHVLADAAYVRESIVAPSAKLVAGYLTLMPSYAGELTPRELDQLVAHVASLSPGSGTSVPASASAAPAEPAQLVIDPVCSMKVRVTDTTPHARHAAADHYFCSEGCRERFAAEPGKYLKTAQR